MPHFTLPGKIALTPTIHNSYDIFEQYQRQSHLKEPPMHTAHFDDNDVRNFIVNGYTLVDADYPPEFHRSIYDQIETQNARELSRRTPISR